MSTTILFAVVAMTIFPFVVRLVFGSERLAFLTILATIAYLYFNA